MASSGGRNSALGQRVAYLPSRPDHRDYDNPRDSPSFSLSLARFSCGLVGHCGSRPWVGRKLKGAGRVGHKVGERHRKAQKMCMRQQTNIIVFIRRACLRVQCHPLIRFTSLIAQRRHLLSPLHIFLSTAPRTFSPAGQLSSFVRRGNGGGAAAVHSALRNTVTPLPSKTSVNARQRNVIDARQMKVRKQKDKNLYASQV